MSKERNTTHTRISKKTKEFLVEIKERHQATDDELISYALAKSFKKVKKND